MKIRMTAAAIALFVVAPLTISRAQTTGTTCVDGTTSTAVGKGACSGHGGIKPAAKTKSDSKTAPAATKADVKTSAPAKTKTEAKTVAPKPKATKSDSGKAKPAAKTTSSKTKTAKADSGKVKPPAATKGKSDAANTDSKDATALCKDGTYSHAATHTGACSGHGGVDKFLK